MIAPVAAYLIGTTPFGLWTARLVAGIDIREHGSRNIGATNVARVVGKKWGAIVLALDALKGILAVLFPLLFLDSSDPTVRNLQVVCGVTAVLGHMFPCWLRFRGGKGVATALGVVTVLAWDSSLAAFGVFAACFFLSRIVSLSSILASLTFAVYTIWSLWPHPFSQQYWSLALFSLAVPALIIVRHSTNVRRLWRGEEPKFQSRASDETGERDGEESPKP
jgi:glycerol-3-phosphate acyltransferase PlsY